MRLKGADLIAAVRHGLTQLGRGGFPQMAGLRLDGATLMIRRFEGWTPVDPAATYAIATNNFLRNGGDGYTVFRDQAKDPYDSGPGLDDAFVRALASREPSD